MRKWLAWIALAVVTAGCHATNVGAQTPPDDAGFAQLYHSGQSAMTAGRFDEALVAFERLEKMDASVAEVHAVLGVLDYKLGKFDSAIEEIRSARKLKPELPGLDSLLSLSLAEIGRYSESLPGLEKGFKQTSDAETRRMCGLQLLRVYSALLRDIDAVEIAVALNRSYPDDPEVLYHTGRIYGNQAYVVMEKLHNKAPESIWMLQAQGEASESQKDYGAAITSFNNVLTLAPYRPGIHYRLGRVYLARFNSARTPEDRAAAKKEFSTELNVDPENGNAAYELAQMAVDDNDLDEARKRFEAIVEEFPEFEQALVGLGGVYLETHSASAAVVTLERATKLNAADKVAWYRLVKAERAAGHRDAADKALAIFRSLGSSTASVSDSIPKDEVTPQKIGLDASP